MNSENNIDKKEEIDEITLQPKKTREFDANMKLPELDNNQKVIETVKKKPTSSIPYIIILLIIAFFCVINIEKVTDFIDSLTKKNNPVVVVNNPDNLVKGYIKINDNTSNIKVDKIKFYNFIKDDKNKVLNFSYVPESKQDNINSKNIYIELYDIDENLIYKTQLLNDEVIYSNEIKIQSISLNADIYTSSYYAYVSSYTSEELNKETILSCTYNETDNYSLSYKNIYHFKNDMLISYDVSKQISYINETDMTKKYKNEIEIENNLLKEHSINSNYDNNTLTYNIDLNNDLNGFIPLYELNTTYYIVKNKDIEKKWNCE